MSKKKVVQHPVEYHHRSSILDKVGLPVTVDGRLPPVGQRDPSVLCLDPGAATCGGAIPVVDGRKPGGRLIDVAVRQEERKKMNSKMCVTRQKNI